MLAPLAALLLSLTPTPVHADDPKPADGLQGEWTVTAFSKGGSDDTAEDLAGAKLVVSGDKMTFTRRKRDEPVTFTLDPKATPAAIDIKPPAGEPKTDKVVKGIYKLEKDTFTLCFGLDGGDRPKEFKAGEKVGLLVAKRVKK